MAELTEEQRQKLNELNREIMKANSDYTDLQERLNGIGKRIADLKIEIGDKLKD